MSRQDFELLARVIAGERELFTSNTAHATFAAGMAHAWAATNGRFDHTRFVMACMPAAWVGTRHANAWERIARNS